MNFTISMAYIVAKCSHVPPPNTHAHVHQVIEILTHWTFPNDLLPAILLHPVQHCKTGNGWMSVTDPLAYKVLKSSVGLTYIIHDG